MSSEPNAAAPDPVKVARVALGKSYESRGLWPVAVKIRDGENDDWLEVSAAILGARAMQSAMSAQGGGEVACVLAEMCRVATGGYDGYGETLDPWTADNRADIDRWLGVLFYLSASPAPEVKGASAEAGVTVALRGLLDAVDAHNVANGREMVDRQAVAEARSALSLATPQKGTDQHELQNPAGVTIRSAQGDAREPVQRPDAADRAGSHHSAPAAASEGLAERLRHVDWAEHYALPPAALSVLEEAAARIEADAAEMERLHARVAELESELHDVRYAADAMKHAMDGLAARATAAEAERDALRRAVHYFASGTQLYMLPDDIRDTVVALRPSAKGGRADVG